jgi:probable HAF family extracellular repeat protein
MRGVIRIVRARLRNALGLFGFAFTLLVTSAVTFADQESGADKHRRRHHDERTFTQIEVPGATFTIAFGINDRGQIVGDFGDAGGAEHGFLLSEGVFTQIDFPGASATVPFAINNRGQITGLIGEAGGAEHGFLLNDGTFTQIDVAGGVDTNPVGLNSRGQIVGHVGPVEALHGFLLDNGVSTQIDFPGAVGSAASWINDRGKIVGSFFEAGGAQHGFLATKEQFNGKASGVGAGEGKAAVEIAVAFTSPTDLDLSASTLTITSCLSEGAGGSALVSGTPVVLMAAPESRRNLALFV